MPINELEQHPCLNYLEQENIAPLNDYQGLIIGNFPSYGCTDTLGDNCEIVTSRLNVPNFRMKFFYSNSPTSFKFWKYISEAYKLPNPVKNIVGNNDEARKEEAWLNKLRSIIFLQSQKLLITDTIWRTNRVGDNFFVAEGAPNNVTKNWGLNKSIVDILLKNKTISTIYFTSSGDGDNPFGLFERIFNNNIEELKTYATEGTVWAKECFINKRYYKVFFIPSERGTSRSNNLFRNFLIIKDLYFYNEIIDLPQALMEPQQKATLSNWYSAFRKEAYTQAFVKQNLDYVGNNPI